MTSIEWTQRPGTKGETWNPIAGCSIVSTGCKLCYAMRQAHRIQAMGGKGAETYAGTTKVINGNPVWTGQVNTAPETTLLKPLRWREPRTVFVNSMSDLFHEAVPDEVIDRIFAVMALTPQHTYQVLTKRSARMRSYFTQDGGFGRWGYIEQAARKYANVPISRTLAHFGTRNLPNVWLGVSAERQQEADERVPDLLATPAAIRFVSAEPMLGPIDFTLVDAGGVGRYNVLTNGEYCFRKHPSGNILDWIIAGGESGPGARPMHPAWVRSIRDQCASAGTAFFFKQWGGFRPLTKAEHGQACGATLIAGCSPHDPDAYMLPVRKSRAGRLLDGREHGAFPLPCVRGRGGSGEARDGEGA